MIYMICNCQRVPVYILLEYDFKSNVKYFKSDKIKLIIFEKLGKTICMYLREYLFQIL